MPSTYTFEPAFDPSYPYEDSRAPRLLKAKYGDGYIERAGDGINIQPRELSLTWDNLMDNELASTIGFFEDRKGYQSFWWVPVRENVARQFVCETWSKRQVDFGVWVVTATFMEVFDP